MKYIYVYLLLFLPFFSLLTCQKGDDISEKPLCGVLAPEVNLVWLKDLISEMKNGSLGDCRLCKVYLETYKSNTIFYIEHFPDNCVACRIYDCNGSLINWEGGVEELTSFLKNLKRNIIVWEYK